MKNDISKLAHTILTMLVFSSSFIAASKIEQQIQSLHKKISDQLLNIRKEYSQTQPIVYSLLDQVCKMYQLSKNTVEKKKKFKKQLNQKEQEQKSLKAELSEVKNKTTELEDKFVQSQNTLAMAAKKLEQKDEIVTFIEKEKNKLIKEKEELDKQRKQLEEEKHALLIKASKLDNTNSSQEEDKKNQAFYPANMKKRHNNNPYAQSLNLTSTSDPISPL